MSSLKKLRKQREKLNLQVEILEQEHRLMELRRGQKGKVFGFYHQDITVKGDPAPDIDSGYFHNQEVL